MTPAVEAAKRAGVEFTLHEYEGVDVDEGDYAVAVAHALGRDPSQLFKTLVARVRDLPVAREGALFLAADIALAWRLFALALLAEELAE